MALLGDFNNGFTRTGNNTFSRWAENLGFVSRVPVLKTLASPLTWGLGMLGAGWEGLGLLFQGKFLSAATAVAAGAAATTVDTMEKIPGVDMGIHWLINPALGLGTGRTAGGLARKGVEEVIGGVTGIFGVKPTILRSYPAGIGSIDSGMAQYGPGQFASAEAQRRGQDPQAYYNSKMNGDMAQHVAELESARSRPNYQGLGA